MEIEEVEEDATTGKRQREELAAILTLVHKNICLFVQEWNAIQEIIATELLDQSYSSNSNIISLPASPFKKNSLTSLEQPTPDPVVPAASKQENDMPPPQSCGPVDQQANPLLAVEEIQREQTSPVSPIATSPHVVMEATTEGDSAALPNQTCNLLVETTDEEAIPGSQIMRAVESSFRMSSQNQSRSTSGSLHCNVPRQEEYSSNRSPYSHTSLPIAGYVPDVSSSDDAFLEACSGLDILPLNYTTSDHDVASSTRTDFATVTVSADIHACSSKNAPLYRSSCDSSPSKWFRVCASDLDRLTAEAMMLKENLPKVVNSYYVSCVRRVPQLEKELAQVRREREQWEGQCKDLSWRCDALMADLEEGRKELFAVKNEVSELRELLSQQSDYCSSMGSSCCMLLWRLSRHEDSIQSILAGSKVKEFLELSTNTLLSFLEAYRSSALPEETSSELQFVLALCGTITNIAASTYGREFLSSCDDGRKLIDAFCSVVASAPVHPNCCKLRGLLLMALYNISINTTGIKYLVARPKFLAQLTRLLREEMDVTNRLHAMRLVQSMMLEQQPGHQQCAGGAVSQEEAVEAVAVLHQLAVDHNSEVRNFAAELLLDISPLTGQTVNSRPVD